MAERVQEARDSGLKTAVASSSTSAWVEGWLERHGSDAASGQSTLASLYARAAGIEPEHMKQRKTTLGFTA